MADDVVTFLRRRDYKYVHELGRGGCGRTVLLHDEFVDLHFVCKKYEPSDPGLNKELFANFETEIRLMYRIHHPNVVRIFHYQVDPAKLLGFIVMEYVEGDTIDKYLEKNPTALGDIFSQTLSAFAHLEDCEILHRDIRVQNILVSKDGVLKVIDLGFGKAIRGVHDFRKSISLNWQFTPPTEFSTDRYDFQTEVYFVGKMFDRIMKEHEIEDDLIGGIVRSMCHEHPRERPQSFALARVQLGVARMASPEFSDRQKRTYTAFADELDYFIAKIASTALNIDHGQIIEKLEQAYQACMLDEIVDGTHVAYCFIRGNMRIYPDNRITVANLKNFIDLLIRAVPDQRRIILANIFRRLDAKPRYDEDEIPF